MAGTGESIGYMQAVIPARRNRRAPPPHDREKYRQRNLIERLFNKLKELAQGGNPV